MNKKQKKKKQKKPSDGNAFLKKLKAIFKKPEKPALKQEAEQKEMPEESEIPILPEDENINEKSAVTQYVRAALLGFVFLISSPLIIMEVLHENPDTRAVAVDAPAYVPENDDPEAETNEQQEEQNPEENQETTEPVLAFVESSPSYFDDALFIGDSRTEDIRDYGTLQNADFLCALGLSAFKVINDNPVKGVTLSEKLSSKDYGKIYIMLGQNEVADSPESFKINMTQLISEIREQAPDALIFLMANLHVSKQLGIDSPSESNERLNVLNQIIEEMADGKTSFYLDVNPLFDDEEGYLPEDASGDGVHPYATYYPQWCEWLCQHTITGESRLAGLPAFDFGRGIEELKKGKLISRKSWGNEKIWIELVSDEENQIMQMKKADDTRVLWTASQEDMLADDWYLTGGNSS